MYLHITIYIYIFLEHRMHCAPPLTTVRGFCLPSWQWILWQHSASLASHSEQCNGSVWCPWVAPATSSIVKAVKLDCFSQNHCAGRQRIENPWCISNLRLDPNHQRLEALTPVLHICMRTCDYIIHVNTGWWGSQRMEIWGKMKVTFQITNQSWIVNEHSMARSIKLVRGCI